MGFYVQGHTPAAFQPGKTPIFLSRSIVKFVLVANSTPWWRFINDSSVDWDVIVCRWWCYLEAVLFILPFGTTKNPEIMKPAIWIV